MLFEVSEQEGFIRGIDRTTDRVGITGLTIAMTSDLGSAGPGKTIADREAVLKGIGFVGKGPDGDPTLLEQVTVSGPGPTQQLPGCLELDSIILDQDTAP